MWKPWFPTGCRKRCDEGCAFGTAGPKAGLENVRAISVLDAEEFMGAVSAASADGFGPEMAGPVSPADYEKRQRLWWFRYPVAPGNILVTDAPCDRSEGTPKNTLVP